MIIFEVYHQYLLNYLLIKKIICKNVIVILFGDQVIDNYWLMIIQLTKKFNVMIFQLFIVNI